MKADIRQRHEERRPYRFTAAEYLRLSERGFFDDCRTEFIDGMIFELPAQSNHRAATIEILREDLVSGFGIGHWVRTRGTLDLAPHGVLDPDLAVIRGDSRRPSVPLPTTALFVIEVRDFCVIHDLTTKASLYAAHGVAEYWILNIPDRQLEIRRQPQPDAEQEFGYGYASLQTLRPGESATPLAAPNAQIPVEQMFFWQEAGEDA